MLATARPLSRNAACPCGSGKKYKHCCAQGQAPAPSAPDHARRELAVTQQLLDAGQYAAAYQRATQLRLDAPNLPHAGYLAGLAAWNLGRWEEGESLLREATAKLPQESRYFANWGALLLNMNRVDDALAVFSDGLRHNPESPQLQFGMAQAHFSLGQFTEAQLAYRAVLRLQPGHDGALLGLSQTQRYTEQPQTHMLLADVLIALEKTNQNSARCNLNYALCKIYDDLGHTDGAMAAAHRANAIEAQEQPYQSTHYQRRLTQYVQRDQRAALPPLVDGAPDMPILIVGLPRSGTSLVEQILTRHPQIGSAGELHFWEALSATMDEAPNRSALLPELRAAYTRILAKYAPDRRQVIDKMPDNFWYVGQFLRAFPQGRIIHCRRNPVDTGLSIYQHRFTGSFDYAHKLEDIADYTRHYRNMVAHWQSTLPSTHWLDVDYERLIGQSAIEIRRLADFVGVPWDAQMLAPHAGQQPVRTSSAWQVRQPIYRHAVERWRRYERHLAALLPLLEAEASAERAA